MRECCDADVRRETLEAREMDERPDLCDLGRAEGGDARRGGRGTGLTYDGALVTVRYATSLSVLDKVDEGCPYTTCVIPTVERHSPTYIHDSPNYHMSLLPSIAS